MPDGTELAVFTYMDITESQGESRRLTESYELFQKDRFYSDPVTGLPNANFLHEFADEQVARLQALGRRTAFVYFDVIGLHSYNHQYTYVGGDALLVLIADILRNAFPDRIVARGADDHFFVIADNPERLPEQIDDINQKIRTGAFGNTRGVHAGICTFTEGMLTAEAMDQARLALRQIDTDLNRNYCFYTPESEARYREQRYVLENFDQALEKGWIRVYYQGIMRISTGKCCALEALARWVDPERGLISPGQFIPVLEKYHLLYRLDLYMVEQICREVYARRDIGVPIIPVSVNFSAQDFDYVNVPEALNRILERHGISHDLIIVEITEQDLAFATDRFREHLHALRRHGFHLWLDDFGSGYSSLNVLSQFDFDMLKFDLELLRNIDQPANRHIMEAMVVLARKLKIQTLAEGMENEAQKAFLNQIGCELAQGFYFYRPQPLEAVVDRLEHGGRIMDCETPEERARLIRLWKQS